jgi:hypothetical protein
VLGDASGLAGLLHHEGASALEAITYAQAPDTFFPTEGKPVPPETPFESLHEAESVLRALGAMGRSVPSIAASLRALKGAWPLFDRRPPESWSAAEVLAACARLMEIGAGHAAACSLLEGVWALWIASDRPDRISATATVLRALEAG